MWGKFFDNVGLLPGNTTGHIKCIPDEDFVQHYEKFKNGTKSQRELLWFFGNILCWYRLDSFFARPENFTPYCTAQNTVLPTNSNTTLHRIQQYLHTEQYTSLLSRTSRSSLSDMVQPQSSETMKTRYANRAHSLSSTINLIFVACRKQVNVGQLGYPIAKCRNILIIMNKTLVFSLCNHSF
jgi:hypothetical protein